MSSRFGHFKKQIDRLSVLYLTRLLLFVSKGIPYRTGIWLGGFLGSAAYRVLPRERNRALIHLRLAFQDRSEDWIRSTAKKSFMHLGRSILEIMMMTPARLSRIADVQGYESLVKAHALGKGVVYVTGHVGNWELMGGFVASRFPLSVVAAPLEPEQVNDVIVMLRGRLGVKVILRGRPGASRDLVRIFKDNRILGVLIDQDTDVDGAFVDFMGHQAWTPTAAASMAIKFNAPVVFGYIHRDKDNRHTITIEGPLELVRTGNDENDIITNTAMFTKKIEACIMKNPEQWVWMHRRWRKQP